MNRGGISKFQIPTLHRLNTIQDVRTNRNGIFVRFYPSPLTDYSHGQGSQRNLY